MSNKDERLDVKNSGEFYSIFSSKPNLFHRTVMRSSSGM